ncbi:nickel-dependent lactate racemase [Paenibacillus hodogayensis]|uniref:Nickel-dependent lactate racemase n=1 Tax=Paenibacillus hodogayensis TaxID=279208 RepID=A0ABV5VSJ2_9BACL
MLFPYGHGQIELPFCVDTVDLLAYHSKPEQTASALIRQALEQPVAGMPLKELAVGRKRAVILISDGTRLSPSRLFLPALLDALNEAGLDDDRIRIIVALGMHRKHTEKERIQLVGEDIYRRVAVVNHSPLSEHCIHVGTTAQGTPIELNRLVLQADLLIATGNIEPHRLVGVSGGVKALVPGVASKRCIQANHALSQRFRASLGDPDNPIHRDLEEALRFVPIHFLFNVVANHHGELLGAYAGEPAAAHRRGLEEARSRFFIPVDRTYDLVVVSPGGHPKDAQLYQAVKTLQNAAAFTKPGGSIMLLSRCEELFGNGMLQYWLETVGDRAEIVARLQQQFVLGAHKIAHMESILSRHTVYLYSQMPEALVELAGFIPVANVQEWVQARIGRDECRVAYMPYGALTFPSP